MHRDTVAVQPHPGWLQITITREEKRNALDRRTRALLGEALQAARGTVRAIVLTGSGGSFCAGLDLKERAAEIAAGRSDTAGEEAIALNMALRTHPAVLIAAVNGVALGGGVTLVNSCDLALASTEATFACPEIRSGGYASMAGPTSQLLLTRKRAAWLLLADERITAATAETWGLVNEVVAPADLLPRAQALAARIASFDSAVVKETKHALDELPASSAPAAWRAAMDHGQTVAAAIRAHGRSE